MRVNGIGQQEAFDNLVNSELNIIFEEIREGSKSGEFQMEHKFNCTGEPAQEVTERLRAYGYNCEVDDEAIAVSWDIAG